MLLNIKNFSIIFHLPFVTNFWFCKKLHRISSAKFHSAYQATWKIPGAVLKRGRVRAPHMEMDIYYHGLSLVLKARSFWTRLEVGSMPAAVWEMSELDKTTESKPNPEISAITAMIRFIGCNTWLFFRLSLKGFKYLLMWKLFYKTILFKLFFTVSKL